MQDLEMKKKIAQEIMDLMDSKDGERLKSKSPKFAKASVIEVDPVEEKSESSDEMAKEKLDPSFQGKESGDEELSPEMIQKLLEMMNGK